MRCRRCRGHYRRDLSRGRAGSNLYPSEASIAHSDAQPLRRPLDQLRRRRGIHLLERSRRFGGGAHHTRRRTAAVRRHRRVARRSEDRLRVPRRMRRCSGWRRRISQYSGRDRMRNRPAAENGCDPGRSGDPGFCRTDDVLVFTNVRVASVPSARPALTVVGRRGLLGSGPGGNSRLRFCSSGTYGWVQ